MNDIKICVDCVHYCDFLETNGESPVCTHSSAFESKIDIVTGEQIMNHNPCRNEREDPNKCGLYALNFEPKRIARVFRFKIPYRKEEGFFETLIRSVLGGDGSLR